ncbi:hypothetical protein [Sporosarcina sp. FSL K6-2383]|uniref:hypothetical protein n=1 Tax=Sporosarcina sp. FSL K6-2383 TaxID=2921556 RepID=UPI00315A1929
MGNTKLTVTAFSIVQEISKSLGVEITNGTGYDDFFKSCVEKMKLDIENIHLRTVFKLINFFESETEPLKEWEKEIFSVLHQRRLVGLCG